MTLCVSLTTFIFFLSVTFMTFDFEDSLPVFQCVVPLWLGLICFGSNHESTRSILLQLRQFVCMNSNTDVIRWPSLWDLAITITLILHTWFMCVHYIPLTSHTTVQDISRPTCIMDIIYRWSVQFTRQMNQSYTMKFGNWIYWIVYTI